MSRLKAATYNDSCRTVLSLCLVHYDGVVLKKPTITETYARYGYLLCFHQRIKPTTVPSPAVPSMNGRAIGITSHAMRPSPSDTIAPARVPGTDKVPNALRDAGRCGSTDRPVKVTSVVG